MNATLQSVTEAVLADASKRTGLEVAKLEVVESIAVTWPDGSLGCLEPGLNYTMALVPGHRIRIKADEQDVRDQVGLSSHSRGPENRCKYAPRLFRVRGINRAPT